MRSGRQLTASGFEEDGPDVVSFRGKLQNINANNRYCNIIVIFKTRARRDERPRSHGNGVAFIVQGDSAAFVSGRVSRSRKKKKKNVRGLCSSPPEQRHFFPGDTFWPWTQWGVRTHPGKFATTVCGRRASMSRPPRFRDSGTANGRPPDDSAREFFRAATTSSDHCGGTRGRHYLADDKRRYRVVGETRAENENHYLRACLRSSPSSRRALLRFRFFFLSNRLRRRSGSTRITTR